MRDFIIRSKKICALLLALVMAFGLVFVTPKTQVKAATKYWIKVNKQANVATVYQLKSGKYKPVKAFLVSCGGSNTPAGTFYTPAKYRWHTLDGPSYGQYCTRIHGGILFHSVWYYSHSKASQSTVEFNKLGTTASHGCVRLSVIDAKWIYDHCALGTKVTIYSSKNPGPLGKPKGIKVSTARKMYWDPTDPDKNNPYNKLKPSITISKKKKKTVQYGEKYSIKSGVTAKQKNKVSLTSKIKYSVKKYSSKQKKYVKAKFSTKSLGTYKITYKVTSKGGTTVYKDFKVKVVDTRAPIITAKNRTLTIGKTVPTNAVSGVTAKQRSGASRTGAMSIYIKTPGASKNTKFSSYSKAKAYQFKKAGNYYIKYKVTNKYKTSVYAEKTIKVVVKYANATLNIKNPTVFYDQGSVLPTVDEIKQDAGITAYDYDGKTSLYGKVTIFDLELLSDKMNIPGSYEVTVCVTGLNKVKISKKIKIRIDIKKSEPVTEQPTTTEQTETTTAAE